MLKKIAVNSQSTGKFRTEVINNRPHIVTEMVSIEGDSVMNGLLYPLGDITNTFSQLDALPAPAGHPTVNGVNVSAMNLFAINAHYVGGMVRKPRMVGKQVVNELVFDIEVANKHDSGKKIIERIENGESIGVSTGLNATVTNQSGTIGATEYAGIVSDIQFDHVAVLLDEPPAGDNTFTINSADEENSIIICNASTAVSVTDFKPVGNPAGINNQEENDMDKLALVLALIGNSANRLTMGDKDKLLALSENDLVTELHNSVNHPAPSVEAAQSVIEGAGLTINAADFDKDAYALFLANQDGFKTYLSGLSAETDKKVEHILANSKMIEADVRALSATGLDNLFSTLNPDADFSAQAQPVTNADRSNTEVAVDYSH
jgi:hypothetical protein